jgi:phosphate transport system permease protein
MSDTVTGGKASRHGWTSPEQKRRIRRRYAADRRLQFYGLAAIGLAVVLLGILVASLVHTGYKAFVQSKVTFEVFLDPERIDPAKPEAGNYRVVAREAFRALFPEAKGRRELRNIDRIVSSEARFLIRTFAIDNPDEIGKIVTLTVPLSDPFDQLHKGVIPAMLDAETINPRFASLDQIEAYKSLVARGMVSTPFNWALFFNSDSRFPEQAGLAGAITGSFYTLLVCFLISFPMGISAAVYLEEFAPKNRLTSLIEVNINNLAAVPSVVFGLLGLAVFLGFFGLPRSAPLVGGMVLSLMTLPTIIIATRAALKAVPPSIREAALGVGASKHQVMLHHVLPLAMPGILTGTIIGLAQALGETAPLLLIGMNAFITSPPGGILEPATALPTQIYSWADSPERGFVSRTSAAILVLLGFLVVMNAIAIFLRQKFERKW